MKPRNPYVVEARQRKAGAIKSRKNKLIEEELQKEIEEWEEDTWPSYLQSYS